MNLKTSSLILPTTVDETVLHSMALGSKPYTDNDIIRVKDFLNRKKIVKQLKTMVSYFIPDKSDIKFQFNIGGGSFTDGSKIVVGLPEYMIAASYEEIFAALLSLTGHEAQHINSSDFVGYKNYRMDILKYFQTAYPKLKSRSFDKRVNVISKYFGNGTEDGRIEKIAVNKHEGFLNYLKFFRGKWWEAQPVQGQAELNDFLFAIVTYATMGLMPKDFETHYKGSEAENQVNILKPMIIDGIHAVKAQECLQICKEMIHTVEPYLIHLLENLTQPDQDQLDNADDSDEYTTSEEKDYNTKTTTSTHFKPEPKRQEKKEEEKQEEERKERKSEKKKSSTSDKNEKEKEKEQEKGKKQEEAGSDKKEENEKSEGSADSDSQEDESDKASGSSDKEDEEDVSEGSGSSSGDESADEEDEEGEQSSGGEADDEGSDDESDGQGGDDDADSDSSSRSAKNDSDEDDSESYANKEDGDSKKDSKPNSSKDSDSESNDQEPGESDEQDGESSETEPSVPDEDVVTKAIEDLLKEIESDVKDRIEGSDREPKKSKKEQAEEGTKLNEEDLKELEAQYKKDSYKKFYEKRGFRMRYEMPEQMKREAKKFRKEIETIFRNKEALTLRGQKRGVIDANSLYKVGAKDYNVFVKRGVPITSDYVAYLLWDGSGSMSEGDKQIQSGRAVAIAEEGLKGIIPFKATQFSVDWGQDSVAHHVVKDFNENDRSMNYAYNFMYHRGADGGNKDGYSIRVATKELMKRPEKDRILIIFSDGLPSDYNGGYDAGMVDVKEAVKEARAKGIFVVSLLFGTETFRDLNIEKYKYMYEKNIISCEPSQITPQLIRMLKKVIAR